MSTSFNHSERWNRFVRKESVHAKVSNFIMCNNCGIDLLWNFIRYYFTCIKKRQVISERLRLTYAAAAEMMRLATIFQENRTVTRPDSNRTSELMTMVKDYWDGFCSPSCKEMFLFRREKFINKLNV